MCWIESGRIEPQIVTKRIPVFKIMRKGKLSEKAAEKFAISWYHSKAYELYKEYRIAEIIPMYGNQYTTIQAGFHSYSFDCRLIKNAAEYKISVLGPNTVPVQEYGFDSWDYRITKVLGYIPEGAVYYLNDEGEYVSDRIVLTEIITL